MSPSKVPDWLASELLEWMRCARSGNLEIEFNCGVPQRLRRGEVVTPPREAARTGDLGTPKLPPQHCPLDGAVMAERDYGEKFQCSQCHTIFAVWDLRKKGKLVTTWE
jgi:hypothetical protein